MNDVSSHTYRLLLEDIARNLADEMFKLTSDQNHPNGGLFCRHFRDLPALNWNSKVLGSELAERYYGDCRTTREPKLHEAFVPEWRPTRYRDFLQDWFLDSCEALRVAPILHRKLWELAYVINVLKSRGMLVPGKRGIVFGVGVEKLPSYFASFGVEILATDQSNEASSSTGWASTDQHSSSVQSLFYPELIDRVSFDRLVRFSTADMNDVSNNLNGQFDFCWSVCAFEHLGSIEKGLQFVERTGDLLRPGGVSVHTTEFNFGSNDETIDNWPTVLFRQKDFEALGDRLRQKGYDIPDVSFSCGGELPIDHFIDVPPYPHQENYYFNEIGQAHLKVMADGFPCTCFGLFFSRQ